MRESRILFKTKFKYFQNNEKQIKLDIIAQNHADKKINKFEKH